MVVHGIIDWLLLSGINQEARISLYASLLYYLQLCEQTKKLNTGTGWTFLCMLSVFFISIFFNLNFYIWNVYESTPNLLNFFTVSWWFDMLMSCFQVRLIIRVFVPYKKEFTRVWLVKIFDCFAILATPSKTYCVKTLLTVSLNNIIFTSKNVFISKYFKD